MAEDDPFKDSKDSIGELKDKSDLTTDTWATLVTHITGYPVPDRSTIFDTLRSDHGGKLFRMDIQELDLSLVAKDSGFLVNKGEDYDIYFFDRDKTMSMMQARIVFEGRVKAGDEVIFAHPGSDNVHDADVRGGNEFTDYNKDKMSSIPLARYMNGPRAALLKLLEGNTTDARFSDLGVPAANIVDLTSFNSTGASFDHAAKFFREHAELLKDWEDRFSRDDASWKGEAADIFRGLLKKVRENYDSYVETFNATAGTEGETGTGKTVYSRALSLGRTYLENAARELLQAWLDWAKSDYYDPHRVLRYVLDELASWVNQNNVGMTEVMASSGAGYYYVYHRPKEGFSQGPTEPQMNYGDLTDKANWAKVGDRAVKLWTQGVEQHLGAAAAKVQSALNNHFLDLANDFSDNIPEPKSTGTASEDYADKKLDDAKDEADRKAAEDKAYADKLRDEANAQRAEDKAEADKLRAEANAQRAEDKAYAEKLRAEAEAQRAEDKAEADKLRAEQKAAADEAKRQADEQATALGESLDGLNGPGNGSGGANDLNLSGLDDLLNGNKPVTESLGDLGGLNNPGSGGLGGLGDVNNPGGTGNSGPGDANKAVTETLNNLGGEIGNQQGATAPPPITQPLGGPGTFSNNPGGTNRASDDANRAITQNLGSLGDLNNVTGGSIDTPTGGSTQLDGGKLTSDFPDGSSSTFDPDSGLVTTTHPDGSVTTRDLGNGTGVTNPDGSVTSLGDDGKLTTTFPDGTSQVVDPTTGQATTTDADGTTTTQNLGSLGDLNGRSSLGGPTDLGDLGDINADLPTQSISDLDLGRLNPGGSGLETPTGGHTALVNDDFATTFPDGSKGVFDADTGAFTMTGPDGSSVTTDLTHGATVTNPDGSTTALDNGQLANTFPDGSKQIIDPDTGIATVTDAQGRTETVNLHDLNPAGGTDSSRILDGLGDPGGLNGSSGLGDLGGSSGLGDLGGLNGSSGSGGIDTSGGSTTREVPLSDLGIGGSQAGTSGLGGGLSGTGSPSTDGFGAVDPLSDGSASSAGTPVAGAAQPGTPGAPGTPGSPGMPMGGGMGGMGGGGEKGNGERVRAVLVDAAEESERRKRRRRSPWNRQEEGDTFLAPASRVATTGGASSEEEAEPRRGSTSSAGYLEEDEDVWGTEEGGAPAVIGR
ncbi:AAWKG family protein [Streptomyces sp. NBC_01166]|uniref:AAWKG family protein n=1 Tax=Streptomyces sp. NBC_01166 TaxID=2903755 RepID=UPI00386616A1|nr:AAWKG family protein [Streptomyces sp. NBC_01166]